MNRRRLRQWFALPDAARSPWKRRLLWCVLFVLVLVGVVIWRTSHSTLGKDVELVNVSREEAELIVAQVVNIQRSYALRVLKNGDLKVGLAMLRQLKVLNVEVVDGRLAKARISEYHGEERVYFLFKGTNGWRPAGKL